MHKNIAKSSDELSAVSAAYNEWNKIVHEEFVQTASKTGKSESVDVMGKFTVTKEYGTVGIPTNNGTCRPASEVELDEADEMCMPVTLTVKDKDGNILHTSQPTLFSSDTAVSPVPDYSQGVVVDLKTPYTAPEDGMIFLFAQNGCAYPNTLDRGMRIDGVIVARATMGIHTEDGYMQSFPVKKGMVIDWYTNQGAYTNLSYATFYPYLGKKVHGGTSAIPPTVDDSAGTTKPVSDTMPIGSIIPFAGNLSNIPDGWALCDGTNGTPNLKDKFIMGWGSNSVGSYVSAGLPNLRGSFTSRRFYVTTGHIDTAIWNFNGAFNKETTGNTGWYDMYKAEPGIGSYDLERIVFDASQFSSIYGASATVQPPSYVVYYIMKIK